MTLPPHPKISPAFEPFLAESGPHDRRDAIVVYRSAPVDEARPRGRLRALKRRLDDVKAHAAAQRAVEERLFDRYRETAGRVEAGSGALAVEPIGGSTLPVATVEVTRATLPLLARQPDVVAILPNQSVHLVQPTVVDYARLKRAQIDRGATWGIDAIGAAEVWETTRGAGINVAVLDTGVHADHPALAGRVKAFVVIDPLGRRIQVTPTFDGAQHGTHVCGTIAGGRTPEGVAIGVAPEAELLVAGVMVGEATLRTLMEGLAWAVERGADIVNLSLGFRYYEPLFTQVFDVMIRQYGILPVVAIGNDNHGNTSSPGNAPDGFSAGAAEQLARGRLGVAFFSGGASLVFPGEQTAAVGKPDVVAPGARVYASIPPQRRPDGVYDYAFMDGTSMAAPHVAGAAALLMAAHPEASTTHIVAALRDTAWHPGGGRRRPDNRWGHGMIRVAEALRSLG